MSDSFAQALLSAVLELLDLGAADQRRRWVRAGQESGDALEAFVDGMNREYEDLGLRRLGQLSVGVGNAMLIADCATDPEGATLEQARSDLSQEGWRFHEETRGSEHQAIRISADKADRSMRIRLLPERGWLFLVESEHARAADFLAGWLDAELDKSLV